MSRATRTIIGLCLLLLLYGGSAFAFDTKARQAFMMDAVSGTVLFQKDADALVPPASLAKLMTIEIVFNALKSKDRQLSDTFTISEDAWRRGGAPSGTSTMFAKLNSQVALQDLIRGITIQSANDACIAVAEGFSGGEKPFADLMNRRARALGLGNSNFANATGLPEPGQQVTMRDMAVLARHIIGTYPDLYRVYAEPDFTWGKITQRNRNPLLGTFDGADGLGLGFTKDVGYSIVSSARRGEARLIVALAGLKSEKERADETRKILEWGFSAFDSMPLFSDGETIGDAAVYGGESMSVPVIAHGPVVMFVATGNKDRLKARVRYTGPLVAPVVKDQPVGSLQILLGDDVVQETPVYAAAPVERGSLWRRAVSAALELATGWYRAI